MEFEVMKPSSPPLDFNFESTNTSPYTTAPSTPQRFGAGFFYSAPTSPARASSFLHQIPSADGIPSTVPFDWEDKQMFHEEDDDGDFAFDFSGQLEPPSISSADELFDCGKIKPLKPPPSESPTSRFRQGLSPGYKKKDSHLFSEVLNRTPRAQAPSERGRQRTTTTSTTRQKASRSLSPLRVSDIISDEEKVPTNQSWYNKWNLKNLLLFRSASEGSATTSKDPSKKYAMIRKGDSDVRNSSFRSTESGGGSVGESRRRMLRKVSAHEIHYTANRAVAEEMRRKTFLPYKSGLLGCLGFYNNGGSVHEISRGISSVMRRER